MQIADADTTTLNPGSPILIVENADSDLPRLGDAIRKAGLQNPLVILPDTDSVSRYLDGSAAYADRKKYPCPELVLLDVTLPKLKCLETPAWLTAPERRQVVIAHLRDGTARRQFKPGFALGPNAVVCQFSTLDSLVRRFQKMLRSPKAPAFRPALRAA